MARLDRRGQQNVECCECALRWTLGTGYSTRHNGGALRVPKSVASTRNLKALATRKTN